MSVCVCVFCPEQLQILVFGVLMKLGLKVLAETLSQVRVEEEDFSGIKVAFSFRGKNNKIISLTILPPPAPTLYPESLTLCLHE